MTRVTLKCPKCGYRARRSLNNEPGSRGTHETSCEVAMCPKGHGVLERVDGVAVGSWEAHAARQKAKR